jgi:hypothetical protein
LRNSFRNGGVDLVVSVAKEEKGGETDDQVGLKLGWVQENHEMKIQFGGEEG